MEAGNIRYGEIPLFPYEYFIQCAKNREKSFNMPPLCAISDGLRPR